MKKLKYLVALAFVLVAAVVCSVAFTGTSAVSADEGTFVSFGDSGVLSLDVTDDSLLFENVGSNKSETNRWADCSAYFTYKIKTPLSRSMYMKTVCDGGDARLLSVSVDNSNWTELLSPSVSLAYKWEDGAAFIKLDDFLSGDYVYIRFADATVDNGFGSSVSLLEFYQTKRVFGFNESGKIKIDLSDENALYDAGNSYLTGSGTRVADNTTFVYKLQVPQTKSILAAFKDHGRDRILQTSSDGNVWTDIETVAQSADSKVDLTARCTGDYLYVRFGDSNYLSDGISDGCGSNVEYLEFYRTGNVVSFGEDNEINVDVTANLTWRDDGSVIGGSGNRFADNGNSFTYKFYLPYADKYDYVLKADCNGGSGRCVLVSGDGVNYVEKLSQKNGVFAADSWGDGTTGYYSVSRYVANDYLYVKFADQTPEDGNGTSVTVLGMTRAKKILNTVLSFDNDKITVDVTDDWQLFENNGSVVNFADKYRFADMTATFTYKIAVPDTKSMYMQTETGNGRKIEVSADNENWTTLLDETLSPAKLPETWENGGSFVLDKYLSGEFVYLRFGDNTPDDGFGGWVKKLEFIKTPAAYTIELSEGTTAVSVTDDTKLYRNGFSLKGANNRFADERRYFVYRVKLPLNADKYDIVMKADCEGDHRFIQLSSGDANYTTVLSQINSIFPNWSYGYPLNDYAGGEYVYIKFADEKTDDGFGSSLTKLEFSVKEKFVPHTIKLSGDSAEVDLTDDKLVYENNGSVVGENGNRFVDCSGYFIYAVAVPAGKTLRMEVLCEGVDRLIKVSSDKENWVEVLGDTATPDLWNGGTAIYDLSYFCSGEKVYVMFADRKIEDGFGSDVRALNFYAENYAEDFSDSLIWEVKISSDAHITSGKSDIAYKNGAYRVIKDKLVYGFDLPETPDYVYARIKSAGSGKISYSFDGKNFAEFKATNVQFELEDNVKYYFVPLSDGEKFYIEFAGENDGIELYSLTVYCQPKQEEIVPESGDYVSFIDSMYAETAEDHLIRELSKFSGEPGFYKGWCFFDQSDYGTFKFRYTPGAVSVRLVATLRYGYRISVSPDGENFRDVAIAQLASTRHQDVIDNTGIYQFDLTEYAGESGYLYVRLGDCTFDYGWGGSFTEMSLISLSAGTVESKNVFGQGKLNARVDVSDIGYLYENNLSYQNYLGRAVKNDAYFTYKFALENDADSFYIAYNGNETLKALISLDGVEYVGIPDMYLLNTYVGDGSATTYNLGEYLKRSKTLYIRFADGNASDDKPSVLYSLYAGYNRTSLSAAEGDEFVNEKVYSFITCTSSENDYLLNPDERNVETGDREWGIIDKEFNYRAKGIYKFTYGETAKALKLSASLSGSFVLSVSKDGINWTDIAVAAQQYYSPYIWSDSQREIYTDISFIAENNEKRTVFVKVSDMVTDNAYGARLKGLAFTEMSGDKKQPDPDSSHGGETTGGCTISLGGDSILFVAVAAMLAFVALCRRKQK